MTEYVNGWLTNLSEYIGELNEELEKAKAENNYLREMLSESRQANEKLLVELKRYKSILQARPTAMNLLFEENAKLRKLAADAIPLIWMGNVDCSGCLHMRECYAGEATNFAPENCRLVIWARELGIEVSA